MANGVNDERHTYAYRQMVKRLRNSSKGGICGICLGAIDRTLKHPDRMSFSLDHIVAIANGGKSTWDNIQAAHLGCNGAKGNKVDKPGSTVNGVVQTWRATRDW